MLRKLRSPFSGFPVSFGLGSGCKGSYYDPLFHSSYPEALRIIGGDHVRFGPEGGSFSRIYGLAMGGVLREDFFLPEGFEVVMMGLGAAEPGKEDFSERFC